MTGKATILLNGKAGGACTLAPTGGWDTYTNLTCGEPGRHSANTGTGMMPDLGFNFTGPVTENCLPELESGRFDEHRAPLLSLVQSGKCISVAHLECAQPLLTFGTHPEADLVAARHPACRGTSAAVNLANHMHNYDAVALYLGTEGWVGPHSRSPSRPASLPMMRYVEVAMSHVWPDRACARQFLCTWTLTDAALRFQAAFRLGRITTAGCSLAALLEVGQSSTPLGQATPVVEFDPEMLTFTCCAMAPWSAQPQPFPPHFPRPCPGRHAGGGTNSNPSQGRGRGLGNGWRGSGA